MLLLRTGPTHDERASAVFANTVLARIDYAAFSRCELGRRDDVEAMHTSPVVVQRRLATTSAVNALHAELTG